VVCGIESRWISTWSLVISVDGVMDWQVDIKATVATRVMTVIGTRLPAAAWTSRTVLGLMSRVVGPVLGIGKVRLAGTAPNGQQFRIGPKRVWAVADSTAVVRGEDLGPVGPLAVQGNLGDFRLPQRGICVVGQGLFDPFDAHRHRDAERLELSR
jgi:hypothetical protein